MKKCKNYSYTSENDEKKGLFFSVKSDFKSDVLKKLEPAPKNHKKGKWLWILPLQKGEKKEEKVTTVISSLLRVKSEE